MKNLKNLILLSLALVFIACKTKNSDDVSPETPIFQDLKVTFNTSTSKTLAKATFRENNEDGTRLVLGDDASLIINGTNVAYYSNVGNYFYHQEFDGIEDMKFVFNKNANDSFTNNILNSEKPSLEMTNEVDTVKLNGTSSVSWSSGGLESNETINYSIHQGNNSGGTGSLSTNGSTSVNLNNIITGGLSAGSANLHISREIEINSLSDSDGENNGKRVIETAITHPIVLIQ